MVFWKRDSIYDKNGANQQTYNHYHSSYQARQSLGNQGSDPNRRTHPKRIIACCDGTWTGPSENSNVLKIWGYIASHEGVVESDGFEQVKFYCSGLGSGDDGFVTKTKDGAFATGIGLKVCEVYEALSKHYDKSNGDEIILIGFSRGAFTVRCVAALIHAMGLSPASVMEDLQARNQLRAQLVEVFSLWEENRQLPWTPQDPDGPVIKAIAVWDTVASVSKRLVVPRLNNIGINAPHGVAHVIQALSINEHRPCFNPEIWETYASAQKLTQTWFAGFHSDVGGCSEGNQVGTMTLLWMIDQLGDKVTWSGLSGLLDVSRVRDGCLTYEFVDMDKDWKWLLLDKLWYHGNKREPPRHEHNIHWSVKTYQDNMPSAGNGNGALKKMSRVKPTTTYPRAYWVCQAEEKKNRPYTTSILEDQCQPGSLQAKWIEKKFGDIAQPDNPFHHLSHTS